MNGSGAGWVDGKTYTTRNGSVVLMAVLEVLAAPILVSAQTADLIGKELSVPQHLEDGQEFQLSITELIAFGSRLFSARWTTQEGQGRPQTKGTGSPLSDPALPLTFPRNFNRLSGPDANSCAGSQHAVCGGWGRPGE